MPLPLVNAAAQLDRWEQESANHTGLLFELYGQYIKMDELTDTLLVLGSLAGIVKLSFDDLVRSYDYIALVEALRTLRLIHHAAWLARRWDDPAFPAAFPWFATPRYWEDRVLELREQIARMQESAMVGRQF